jgi:hypothetical protein
MGILIFIFGIFFIAVYISSFFFENICFHDWKVDDVVEEIEPWIHHTIYHIKYKCKKCSQIKHMKKYRSRCSNKLDAEIQFFFKNKRK